MKDEYRQALLSENTLVSRVQNNKRTTAVSIIALGLLIYLISHSSSNNNGMTGSSNSLIQYTQPSSSLKSSIKGKVVNVEINGNAQGLVNIETSSATTTPSSLIKFGIYPESLKSQIKVSENMDDGVYKVVIDTPKNIQNNCASQCSVADDLDLCTNVIVNGNCQKVMVKLTLKIPSKLNTLAVKVGNPRIEKTSSVTDEFDKLSIESTNGKVSYSNVNAVKSVWLSTTNGALVADTISGAEVKVTSSNGKVTVSNVQRSESFSVKSTNGVVSLSTIETNTASITTTNGAVSLTKVNTSGGGSITTTNGKVHLSSSRFNSDFKIKTTNGKVEGDLSIGGELSCETTNGMVGLNKLEFTNNNAKIKVHTGNGRVNLKTRNFGGKFTLETKQGAASISDRATITVDRKVSRVLGRHLEGYAELSGGNGIDVYSRLGSIDVQV